MKKRIFIIILLMFIFIPFVKAEHEFSEYDVPEGTYIIGKYMYTRNTEGNYDGKLTTKRIMLASKTITGTTEADMIIYYKNARGVWVDGLTGEALAEFDDSQNPSSYQTHIFNITSVDMNSNFDQRTVTDTKQLNNKTLNLEYRLSFGDHVTADLYVNNTKIYSFDVTSCGGACELSENIAGIKDFNLSDIESGIINGDKEYLYLIVNEANILVSETNPHMLVIDDTGKLIFSEGVGYMDALDSCPDQAFFNQNHSFSITRGTPDKLYYVDASDDGWHGKKFEVTFTNSAANRKQILSCTLTAFGYSGFPEIDTDWYEDDKITKTVTVGEEQKPLTIAYYLVDSLTKASQVTFDIILDDVLVYSTNYISPDAEGLTRADAHSIAQQYDFGIIKGLAVPGEGAPKDYIYLKEYKNITPSGGDSYISIFNGDYYELAMEGPSEVLDTIRVGRAGQGIHPTSSHPNYSKYFNNSYYIEYNTIYYLEQTDSLSTERANEYKATISANGKFAKTFLGEIDAIIEGTVY